MGILEEEKEERSGPRRVGSLLSSEEGKREETHILAHYALGRRRRRCSLSSPPTPPPPQALEFPSREREGGDQRVHLLDTEPDLKTDENKAGAPKVFSPPAAGEGPASAGPDDHTYARLLMPLLIIPLESRPRCASFYRAPRTRPVKFRRRLLGASGGGEIAPVGIPPVSTFVRYLAGSFSPLLRSLWQEHGPGQSTAESTAKT